jgi:hypothetical protein
MPNKLVRTRTLFASALLFSLIASVPGCQVWNAVLDSMKWQIAEDKKKNDNGKTVTVMLQPKAGSETQPPGPPAMVPQVRIYRIVAPVGTFSANEKVWTELNEDALDSKMSVLMAQNGLRAGTGNISRWPLIANLIEGPGVDAGQPIFCKTDGRTSLNIVTRPGVTEQIVISIDHDLQQQGRTFEACDNGFRLSMRGIRGKQQLQVQLEPYVALGMIKQVREGHLGIAGGGVVREESFSDLTMGALLNADQFLVVAPVEPKTNRFSVGSLWLSDVDKVPAVETVLIFVPANSTK